MKTDCVASIVNQLFDLAEVPVKKRQEVNDIADDYVNNILIKLISELEVLKLDYIDTRADYNMGVESAIDFLKNKLVNKCKPNQMIYLSNPEQRRCVVCKKYWFVKDGTPNCITKENHEN